MRAVSLDAAVGLARAWHDRFVIRDIVDLHAAADFSYADIENLARRHEPALDLETILDHLAGISVFPTKTSPSTAWMSQRFCPQHLTIGRPSSCSVEPIAQ